MDRTLESLINELENTKFPEFEEQHEWHSLRDELYYRIGCSGRLDKKYKDISTLHLIQMHKIIDDARVKHEAIITQLQDKRRQLQSEILKLIGYEQLLTNKYC